MIWIILEHGQDILVLSIVSMFCKFRYEITSVRNPTSKIMAKFHEQREITPEGILVYRPH